MTFRGHSFFSWREIKDPKIVIIASFAALAEEDIFIIRRRGLIWFSMFFLMFLVSSVLFYFY